MKKSASILCILCPLFLLLFTACTTPNCKPTPTSESFFDVDDELDRLHGCSGAKLYCGGNNALSDLEMIDQFSNSNFVLWSSTSSNKQFNNTEVDAFLQAAETKAKADAPKCPKSGASKAVYDIDFVTNIVTGGSGGYILGIKVTYACCDGEKPH